MHMLCVNCRPEVICSQSWSSPAFVLRFHFHKNYGTYGRTGRMCTRLPAPHRDRTQLKSILPRKALLNTNFFANPHPPLTPPWAWIPTFWEAWVAFYVQTGTGQINATPPGISCWKSLHFLRALFICFGCVLEDARSSNYSYIFSFFLLFFKKLHLNTTLFSTFPFSLYKRIVLLIALLIQMNLRDLLYFSSP